MAAIGWESQWGSSLLLHCVTNEKRKSTQFKTSLLVGDSNKIGALVVVGASPHDPLGLYLRLGWTWQQNIMQWLL